MDAIVKSFHPASHNVCYMEHPLRAGAGPVGFRVWHKLHEDENPVISCGLHLAEAVRVKEKEGDEVAEQMAFEEMWLDD